MLGVLAHALSASRMLCLGSLVDRSCSTKMLRTRWLNGWKVPKEASITASSRWRSDSYGPARPRPDEKLTEKCETRALSRAFVTIANSSANLLSGLLGALAPATRPDQQRARPHSSDSGSDSGTP